MKKLSKRLLALLLVAVMLVPTGAMMVTSSAATRIPDDAVKFNGHYYKIYNYYLNWEEAREFCELHGGHLATITSAEEQKFIETLATESDKLFMWLGAKRINGNFSWITGEPWSYANWQYDEPNNIDGNEDCVCITNGDAKETHKNYDGKWLDAAYNNPDIHIENLQYAGFICEWDVGDKTQGEYTSITIGDYIALGTYYGEPIVWRCVDIDENGPLMLSDKILCLKAFDANGEDSTYHSDGWGYIRKGRGSNCWSDSNIRQWLNTSGNVEYTHCAPTAERVYGGYNPYADELGFLTNFSNSERVLIKTVTQKNYLNSWDANSRAGYLSGGAQELNYSISLTKVDYSNYFYQNVTDSIFLLNPSQANAVAMNIGENYLRNAYPTQAAVDHSDYKSENLTSSKPWVYFSAIPGNEGASYENLTVFGTSTEVSIHACDGKIGIRPAFYLNTDVWEEEQTITGTLTGSADFPVIAIDYNWYNYDANIPELTETINKMVLMDQVYCKMRAGKIVACSNANVKPLLSISPSCHEVTYDSTKKEYSAEKIDLQVNIVNSMSLDGAINILNPTDNGLFAAGFDITFDTIKIEISDDESIYFKDGIFGLNTTNKLEKKLQVPKTLKAGETFKFNSDLTAFINDNYKWGDTEQKKAVTIIAYAYNGDKQVAMNTLTINVLKTQTSESSASTGSSNTNLNSKIENSANLLKNTTGIMYSSYLEELLTTNGLTEATNELKCKVALTIAMVKLKQEKSFEDKLIDGLMKKAGISKKMIGDVYEADVIHSVIVDTKEHGIIEVEFKMPLSIMASENFNMAGWSFTITYKIKHGKNISDENRTGSILGYFGTVDENFAKALKEIALEQIENAYDYYKKDVKKVFEILFDDTIKSIVSKAKTALFSHVSFESMTYPSKQVNIGCPVDVYVFDSDGNLCASVEDNEITRTCDDIDLEVVGDKKYLTLYKGDYSVKIIATANDYMNIEIEEYSSKNRLIRSATFNNILLEPGDLFSTVIDENYIDNGYQIVKNDEDLITADANESYIHYVDTIEIIDKEATCTKNGEYHVECTKCNETVSNGIIVAIGHKDDDCNGICDVCADDMTTDCSHLCHNTNSFMQFIWKIAKFFYRLFGMNQYCDCGMAHW